VLRAARDAADRATATVQASLPTPVVAAAAHPDGATALILTASGSLFRMDVSSGVAETLADDLINPIALTIDAGERLAIVLRIDGTAIDAGRARHGNRAGNGAGAGRHHRDPGRTACGIFGRAHRGGGKRAPDASGAGRRTRGERRNAGHGGARAVPVAFPNSPGVGKHH
jgi:hypothetical protein